jgi:uncharacterized protein YlxP (DUF503 family)
MVIAISVFELHLPQARSLKQKRKVIKSLIDRIHGRFRLSIAETGFHDKHQRSQIGMAAVAQGVGDGQRIMQKVRELIDQEMEAVLTHWDPQILEGME